MKPIFRTNLDVCKDDVLYIADMWPDNVLPVIGGRFQMLHYELEVVEIRYEPLRTILMPPNTFDALGKMWRYRIIVELHTPSWFKGTILEWEERVKKQRQAFFEEGKRWPMVNS